MRKIAVGLAVLAVALGAKAAENSYIGAKDGDWDTDSNWSLERTPTSDDEVFIGNLSVKATGAKTLAAKSLTILGSGSLTVGAENMIDIHPEIAIVGNLTLNDSARLTVYAGMTNATTHTFATGGATVTVGGKTTLNGTSSILPATHYNNTKDAATRSTGAPVLFKLQDLEVAEGASFNANSLGFGRYSYCPSGKDTSGDYIGGSYGGRGGFSTASKKSFNCYGFALAPFYPGGGGGNGTRGGGAIRIDAKDVVLNGKLTANGTDGGTQGGGAGGGIWLTCANLTMGANAKISANGGMSSSGNANISGGGGGGRISVCLGLTAGQVADLYATGTAAGIASNQLAEVYSGRISVIGRHGRTEYTGGSFTRIGQPGTAYLVFNAGDGKVPVTVRQSAEDPAVAQSAYGVSGQAAGAALVSSVTSPAFVFGSTDTRAVCTGYDLVDETTGATFDSGEGASVSERVVPEHAVSVVWRWQKLENRLQVGAHPNGSVDQAEVWAESTGNFAAVTATAADGYEFQYWTGDVDANAERFANPIVLKADRPRRIKAFFGKVAGGEYTWNKSNQSTVYNWHDAANWTPAEIPGTNDTVVIAGASGNRRNVQVDDFAKVKALDISGSVAFVRVGSSASAGSKEAKSHAALTKTGPVGLAVVDALTLGGGATLAVGGDAIPYAADIFVGGDFTVGDKATLLTFGGSTNFVSASLFEPTSRVKVGGTFTVASSGVVYTDTNYKDGGSVLFEASAAVIAEGGKVTANQLGYAAYDTEATGYIFPWPGHENTKLNTYIGAYHGGRGGNKTNNSYIGTPYGCKNEPVHPGMEAGNSSDRGSGVIRFRVGAMTLNGSLTSRGADSSTKGGCAGGSVWLDCDTFTAGENAVIDVAGGTIARNQSGGGAGGRASVTVGLSDEQRLALRTSDEVEGVKMSPLVDLVSGFTALGGQKGAFTGCTAGEDGTGVYILNTEGSAPLNVVGEPENFGVADPPYGMVGKPTGQDVTATVSGTAEVVGSEGGSRRICTGYAVTNLSGSVKSGTGASVTFAMPEEETWLVWKWETLQHKLVVSATAGGSVTTNAVAAADSVWQDDGAQISLTAVAEPGFVFAGWLGKVAGTDRTKATIAFAIGEAEALTALFAAEGGTVKTWTGGSGSWLDGTKWSPAGVPGLADTVVIGAKAAVTVDAPFTVPVGSMTIAKNATVTVADTADAANDEAGLHVVGSLVLDGKLTVGTKYQQSTSVLEIGGDLVVTNGASSALTVRAGYREHPELPETYREGGGRIAVAGKFHIGAGSVVYPYCEPVSGAPVIITAARFVLDAGGAVNANAGGYNYRVIGGARIGYAPGTPSVGYLADYDGASHGGLGAPNNGWTKELRTATYDKSFAPCMPGSPGANAPDEQAGGAIRIDCGQARIAGKLLADGRDGGSCGAASGGSIWLTCRHLRTFDTAVFSAKGGKAGGWSASGTTAKSGSGGGGRICIMSGISRAEADELYEAAELPAGYRLYCHDLTTAEADLPLKGRVCVDGGANTDYSEANFGRIGSAILVAITPGLSVIVR